MGTPYLGEIRVFAFNFPPKGWAFCNGQTMPINQNQALFSLLGTTYGGNGTTTFLLPNFQGNCVISAGTNPGGHTYNLGGSGGESFHTLIVNEMPQHSHRCWPPQPMGVWPHRSTTILPPPRSTLMARPARA